MSESQQQKMVISWFRIQYPQHHLIAIPNAQKLMSKARNPHAMQKILAMEGLTPGVSDLFLCVPIGKYHGMWLELKDKGKTQKAVSDNQWCWIGDMIRIGYYADVGYGFDDARAKIEDYLNGF